MRFKEPRKEGEEYEARCKELALELEVEILRNLTEGKQPAYHRRSAEEQPSEPAGQTGERRSQRERGRRLE
jgi:hypothetical protein